MTHACLVILMGLPAAGKTSLSKQLTEGLLSNKEYKIHTIEFDTLLRPVTSENYQNCFKELRNHALASTEQIIQSINTDSNDTTRHVIFIDDNMYYRSMRYEYYKLARKYENSFLQIYVDILLETAISRNKHREKKQQVPESIIRDMSNKFELPRKESWESNFLVLSSNFEFNAEMFETFLKTLETCFNKPILKLTQTNKTGTLPQTNLQNIDLLLRKIVHAKLVANKNDCPLYISRRKEIYKAIKNGEININEELNSSELYNYLDSLF